jgi:hypothetical protein
LYRGTRRGLENNIRETGKDRKRILENWRGLDKETRQPERTGEGH